MAFITVFITYVFYRNAFANFPGRFFNAVLKILKIVI